MLSSLFLVVFATRVDCYPSFRAMECAEPFFSDVAHKIVGVETILLCIFSFILQVLLLKMTHKFCGWQSDFSYTLIRMMNIVGAIFYATEFVGHLRFILFTPNATIDRFIGAVFMACFLTDTLIGMCLVAHRVVYTIIPFKAERILTPVVLKIILLFIAVYFIAMTCFMCTPVAGVMYCPRSMTRYIVKASLTMVINWMNTVSNYLVGISTVTAYTFLLIFLFIRGNITFRSNAELRMMVQIAVMSTIGLFYFLYWEFRQLLNLDRQTATIIYENLTLFYYDAVVLPYLLLNKTFRDEFVRTFSRKKQEKKVFCITVAKIDSFDRRASSAKN
ncbi:hypothetical protein Y032_0020g42 [Ancylostoma ceylanicum]|nr:hypothetical protein Y032_0020g42 [Ancylostoma ceylanicum]